MRSHIAPHWELIDAMGDWESDSDDRVLAAAARDPRAFAAFYERYERPMLGFFVRRTADPELAADLTAEVFAAALDACARYRLGQAPASAWLFGIAQHKLAKSRRRGVVEDRARRRLGMAPLTSTTRTSSGSSASPAATSPSRVCSKGCRRTSEMLYARESSRSAHTRRSPARCGARPRWRESA